MYCVRQISNVVIPSSFINPSILLRDFYNKPIKFRTRKEAESFVSMQGHQQFVKYEIVEAV
jgi:hypothetical protein